MADTRIATDTMKAFVFKGIGETAVDNKPIPEPAPNEAVVRTTAALVCTSDVHTVKGAIPVEPNVTLGHEAVGVVHSLGSAVEGFSEGDRVAVGAVTPCFQCDYCQRGFPTQCKGMLGGYKFTGQPDADPRRAFRPPSGVRNRHALDRLHGRRARGA
jgi:threonine dehydrogenase-like Zn-dependent dehydrogenase